MSSVLRWNVMLVAVRKHACAQDAIDKKTEANWHRQRAADLQQLVHNSDGSRVASVKRCAQEHAVVDGAWPDKHAQEQTFQLRQLKRRRVDANENGIPRLTPIRATAT